MKFRVLFLVITLLLLAFLRSASSQITKINLDFYINAGLSNSPLLKDYKDQKKALSIDSLLIIAGQSPQVKGIGQFALSPTWKGYGYDEALSNGGIYAAMIGISQSIFNDNILKNQYNGIEIQQKSLENHNGLSKEELKKSIGDQYITYWENYTTYKLTSTEFTLVQEEVKLMKTLVETGVMTERDYIRLQIEMKALEIDLKQQQNQFLQDQYMLNLICGIADTTFFIPEKPEFKMVVSEDFTKLLILNQFHIDSLQINNAITTLQMKYKPGLSWFADAGLNTSPLSTVYQLFGFSFGLNVVIPIYDGNQRAHELNKLNINRETRSAYRNFFENQYSQRKEMIKADIRHKESIILNQKQKIVMLENELNFEKQQLTFGTISITDYILTMRSLNESRKALNSMEAASLRLINALNSIIL